MVFSRWYCLETLRHFSYVIFLEIALSGSGCSLRISPYLKSCMLIKKSLTKLRRFITSRGSTTPLLKVATHKLANQRKVAPLAHAYLTIRLSTFDEIKMTTFRSFESSFKRTFINRYDGLLACFLHFTMGDWNCSCRLKSCNFMHIKDPSHWINCFEGKIKLRFLIYLLFNWKRWTVQSASYR